MSKESYKYNSHFAFNRETRWASEEEIKKSATKINLANDSCETAGLPLICDAKEAWVDGLDNHTLIFGATGSKKTRLFCMPTINMMIKAGESFIVTDPKGEICSKTYESAKKNGYKTIVLNFRELDKGECWNPFDIPYKLYKEGDKNKAIALINDLIEVLTSKIDDGLLDAFWIELAHSLTLANAILLMECGNEKEVNINSLAALSGMGNSSFLKRFASFMDPKSIAGINYKNIFNCTGKTLQSIYITVYSMLRIFNIQPELSRKLSASSFDITSIGKEKTAIYIIVPDEKVTYHFLASAFIKQLYETLIEEAQNQSRGMLPIRVNFVLDEFCNMPKIPAMPSMISAARSRNMRFFLVAQNIHQLVSKYGKDADTIKGNCENWVFLTSKELTLLQEISDLCGNYCEAGGNRRNLISVAELQHLNKEKGEALILYGRNYPFITYLPDIDDYLMFKNNGVKIDLPTIENDYSVFDLRKYTKKIRMGQARYPFSEEKTIREEDFSFMFAAPDEEEDK